VLPGEPGYDDARSVWNAMIDKRPAAMVRCLGTADVIACVNFAREQKLPLSIKGGGHNIAGLAVCDGGLTLDMSLMRGVWVDPAAKIARAQAGCLLGDVDRETQLHGLAACLGFVSATGVAGLTLGGGFGYLSRRFGWTCDTVNSMDVVTADGRLVRASDKENPELFWGLRGGGGNFGVVTSFEYRLQPVGPEIVGGAIAWPAEEAPKALELYRSIAASAPPEFALVAGMRRAPPAPWIAKEMHGKPIVAFFVCHSGPVADGEKAVAPIKAFGKPVGDIVMRRSYVSQQSLLDATQPKGRRYYWKSEYLPGIGQDMLGAYMQHAASITSPFSAILLFPIDGALNKLPAGHSPAGNRDAKAVLNIAAAWEKATDDAEHVEGARAVWRDMKRFSTGGTYVNFLTEEEVGERVAAAYGKHVARLAQVKKAWDPGNLFRVNKNIAP
jgi:FAD/FMN-containing dehydrogenase